MPRKAKEEEKNVEKETIKKSKATTKKSTKKSANSKKASNKEKKSDSKQASNTKKKSDSKQASNTKKKSDNKQASNMEKKSDSKQASNISSSKKTAKSVNKVASQKTAKKEISKDTLSTKTPSKKVSEKKVTTTQPTSKKQASKKTVSKTQASKKQASKVAISEYYDLPYRYSQTVVKVLAQTPNTLFVYWDISDEDRKKYIEQYGPYFFNDTKPVLVVHNKTKNYDFEVDINDFANSWYLHLVDSNCEYEIELGRRPINEYAKIEKYLPISNSNSMKSPNDHILLDKLSHVIYFKNVKTNEVKTRTTLSLLKKIGKFSSIAKFYQTLYPKEEINFTKLDLRNPSSSSFFK